jgi:hypothetical protein
VVSMVRAANVRPFERPMMRPLVELPTKRRMGWIASSLPGVLSAFGSPIWTVVGRLVETKAYGPTRSMAEAKP